MNWLGEYSNGWGHLIMSVVLCTAGMVLILVPWTDTTTKGIGTGIITMAAGQWLVTSAAKSTIAEVVHQMPTQPLPVVKGDQQTQQESKS